MEKILCEKKSSDGSFNYAHKIHKGEVTTYKLHKHQGYELLILLRGAGTFMVEGTSYSLQPLDIIITRCDETHQMTYDPESNYERVVIHLNEKFFKNAECLHYKEIFIQRNPGENNLIVRDSAEKSLFIDTLLRLEKYIKQKRPNDEPLIKGILIELLHILNDFKTTGGSVESATVKNIINYINAHLEYDLSLDELADKFFISKYYLCRSFKKHTGFTVNQYITYRRLLLARELIHSGKSLSDASAEAGYANYSNFYKAYVKETGLSPRAELKSSQKNK